MHERDPLAWGGSGQHGNREVLQLSERPSSGETGPALAAAKSEPAPVFVTAFPDKAVDAFEIGAVDYVLKPCRQRRLDRAIARIRNKRAD
ncbi:LytTR family DNA-binding domain-containing protein [Amycolatopsis sp. FDAARGOS 1241]|uniref:LytR/AlgR family response regulator transcription factor n=1 Tax=Amycolatopsis sp. FDAARGOS 1241 TaxID=2778070 RepID=UPI00194F435C|nr:hypothetical protein I6J71_13185 [Amycolatopsis sp. FDAARGOS 1241]